MKMFEVGDRSPFLIDLLVEVWADSVKILIFLSKEEIENIDKTPIAFMGIEDNKLEMLFIKNSERKKALEKIINLWYNTLWS